MNWLTTSTILEGLRDFGNQTAWDRFANRFRRPIAQFARRLGLGDSEAQDVVQETLLAFAQAYRNGAYDRGKGRLSNWLFGIAYREILKARRRLAQCPERSVPDGESTSFWNQVPEERDADLSWNEEWRRAMLKQCLSEVQGKVAPFTFRAFEMVVLEKRPPAEVAEELGVSRNRVFVAKHRVTSQVRRLCEEYESAV